MKITKYQHACLVLEEQGKTLVIDPGVFTSDFPKVTNVVGVVVTHEHPDHNDPKKLSAIFENNPDAILLSTESVLDQFTVAKSGLGKPGKTEKLGPFSLEFFGGKHEQIHSSIPIIDNLGVLVNDKLYYPGDSYAKPGKPVRVLAMPVSAPWLRVNEAIDFLNSVKPKQAFPTHNALLSETGHGLYNRVLGSAAKKSDIHFLALEPGKSLNI